MSRFLIFVTVAAIALVAKPFIAPAPKPADAAPTQAQESPQPSPTQSPEQSTGQTTKPMWTVAHGGRLPFYPNDESPIAYLKDGDRLEVATPYNIRYYGNVMLMAASFNGVSGWVQATAMSDTEPQNNASDSQQQWLNDRASDRISQSQK